jgi:hypothetical protein
MEASPLHTYEPQVPGVLLPRRLARVVAVDLTIVLLVVVGAWEMVTVIAPLQPQIGGDLAFFQGAARRWLETGVLYLPHQLAGPHEVVLQVDNLYPPHALLLFLPFTILPAVLWWIIPIGVTAYVIARLRPATWSWPLLAVLLLWPKTIVGVLWGNTDMWIVAAVAAGLWWRWPVILVTIKPFFAPYALLGVGSRWFWVATALIGAVSLAMLPLWLDYAKVVTNVSISSEYLLRSVPTTFIPIVAWLARTVDRRSAPVSWPFTMLRSRTGVAAGNTLAEADRP